MTKNKQKPKKKYFSLMLTHNEFNVLRNNRHCISFLSNLDRIAPRGNIKHTRYDYERDFEDGKYMTQTQIPTLKLQNIYRTDLCEYVDELNVPKGFVYEPKVQRPSTVMHLGQLKLFLCTFQFLTKYTRPDKDNHVVYPGSAPGDNIELLIKFFPNVRWYLYDPRKFNDNLVRNKRVVICKQDFFLERDIKELNNLFTGDDNVLLISDIRDCDDVNEQNIDNEMRLQEKWVTLLKPSYAQLKFRIPRLEGVSKYRYLYGKLYLQMYAPQASTETRLVCSGKDIQYVDYNVSEYEGYMCYFNRVLRPSIYQSKHKLNCLDSCHDCTLFKRMIETYIAKTKININVSDLIKLILRNIKHNKTAEFRLCDYWKQLGRNMILSKVV